MKWNDNYSLHFLKKNILNVKWDMFIANLANFKLESVKLYFLFIKKNDIATYFKWKIEFIVYKNVLKFEFSINVLKKKKKNNKCHLINNAGLLAWLNQIEYICIVNKYIILLINCLLAVHFAS